VNRYYFDIDLFSEGTDPIAEAGCGHLLAMETYTDARNGVINEYKISTKALLLNDKKS
jgi:hypothetical protein